MQHPLRRNLPFYREHGVWTVPFWFARWHVWIERNYTDGVFFWASVLVVGVLFFAAGLFLGGR